ncbi:piwi-like protein 1 [Branchiostoma floridae x Branchiostoma japonicum]
MTGRARGRARGRGRAAVGGGAVAEEPSSVGRGRGRGRVEEPPRRPGEDVDPPAPTAPPSSQMEALSIGKKEAGAAQPFGGRRRIGDVDIEVPNTRPAHMQDKKGSTGKPVSLVTNYFPVTLTGALYQYSVSFDPEVEHKGVLFSMLKEHLVQIGETYAFDGMILLLPKRLEQKETVLSSKQRSDGADIKITITLTNELSPTSPMCIQLYNILFRKALHEIGMKRIGRNNYNPGKTIQVPQHGLEVWPGLVTSVLQYETKTLLMADVSHKILYVQTVLQVLYDLYNQVDQARFHEVAARKLVGLIVLTRYNNRTYRIDEISWDARPTDKFKMKDGTEMTYVEYYAKKYSKTLTDMNQPMLVSRPKKKMQKGGEEGVLHILPELCSLTGFTEEMRANFTVMRDLSTHTRLSPGDRNNSLHEFIKTLNSNEKVQKDMKGWGLSFDKTLLKLEGRVMPPEKIFQNTVTYSYKPQEADWSREMRGKQLMSSKPMKNWLLLFTARDSGIAQAFKQTLVMVASPMGMNINEPVMCELKDDRPESYLQTMREQMNDKTQMVVCIVSNNRKDRYDAIKKFCCVDRPVPSQVIVSRTLSKKQMLMSVCTKVALQMNCKLGGELWALEIPIKNLMVVGINCYQDSLTKGQSVGGVIASINSSLTRWYSRCTFQRSSQELIDGLKVCLQAALKKYQQLNMNLPEHVILYRDGVARGQLDAVVGQEIPQVIDTFTTFGVDYTPKVTWIVVNKHVNTRFFEEAGGGLQNPCPGTVVDSEVTRPQWYDFFLVSGTVRQGTVTPCHYNVVWDTSGLKPDHMQRLTYKLCHLYYNWPGTIRVPAPCQYAHKLAFLVGQSIHTAPSENLADCLYFL